MEAERLMREIIEIEARDYCSSDQSSRNSENWNRLDSQYILKVKLTEFYDGLNVRFEKNDSKVFGLSEWSYYQLKWEGSG